VLLSLNSDDPHLGEFLISFHFEVGFPYSLSDSGFPVT
jgi:hypothetical protein